MVWPWGLAMAKRYRVTLTSEERDALDRIISRGRADARKLAHARVLLQADASEVGPGWADAAIVGALRVSARTVERVRQRFVEQGLEAALLPKPSSRIYARKLDGAQEARLIALACSDPPDGKARWTLRLRAEQMVALEIVSDLSHETVRQVLGEKCAQAASAPDVVHSAQALGRVRLPHGRRAGRVLPTRRSAAPGGLPGRMQQATDR